MTEHELTCGLEIHQQLDTKKLFCDCQTVLVEEEGDTITRRLRPTQSELGEIDRAALVQAEKKMRFRYQTPHRSSCLVDADEEPPHAANAEALDIVLTVAAMLQARPVDEVHFMRKLVIDGSNTTGFQRTAMVAMDGFLEVNGRKISVPTFCLEEDAARKVDTKAGEVTYRLDRLGIPLIEVATGPELHTPEEVKEAAQRLGSMMRATRKVKRGIGTIREDVNISIPGGARVEIKGVQELRLLPLYVEKEVERQRSLLRIKEMLKERGVSKAVAEIKDHTALFASCPSKVMIGAIKKGGKVLGAPLHGFAGVMRSPDATLRLGAEMAQYARTKGVAGIFHSDELPNYGIDRKLRRSATGHHGPGPERRLRPVRRRWAKGRSGAARRHRPSLRSAERCPGRDQGPPAGRFELLFEAAAWGGQDVPRDGRAADHAGARAHRTHSRPSARVAGGSYRPHRLSLWYP